MHHWKLRMPVQRMTLEHAGEKFHYYMSLCKTLLNEFFYWKLDSLLSVSIDISFRRFVISTFVAPLHVI